MEKIKKLAVIGLSVLLIGGCGSKRIPTLENGQQVVTSIKDDKKISINDLYDSMKKQYGLEVLMNMVDKLILEDKYSGDKDAARDYAKNTLEQLKQSYGDDLLQAIQYYTNYNTLEEYEDSVYLSYLQQKTVTEYAKKQIKDADVKKYYNENTKPDIKVSYILIDVKADANASEEDKNKANTEAQNKAKEVIDKLNSSNNVAETFKELAKEYSSDTSTKEDGGNLGYINTTTLGDSYKNVVDAAYKLKDGEYTKEAIKSDVGYNIVYRTETKEKASLDEVKDSILDTLAQEYVSKNSDAQIKAMQELRKEYKLEIVDDELHTNYVNYIQNSLAQIQKQAQEANKNNTSKK